MKLLTSFMILLFILTACMSEENSPEKGENHADIPDSEEHTEKEDIDNTEDSSVNDDKNEPDDEDSSAENSFCVSGDALVSEGSQRIVRCETSETQLQIQICEREKWKNHEDCIDRMNVVENGIFNMGCSATAHEFCKNDALPMHEVELASFKIDIIEVTVREYEKCIESGVCSNEEDIHYRTRDDSEYCNLHSETRKNHPANCISWKGASAYCSWKDARLPTEAEWEYAARGKNSFILPWGKEPLPDCEHAVIKKQSYGCNNGITMPTGTKPEGLSPFGLYDMAGNVSEFVSDLYDPNFYETSEASQKNPSGPEKTEEEIRIVRGGSFTDTDKEFYSYFRVSCNADDPSIKFGFRCVKDIE